jgi:hypothetical protein
VNRSSRLQLHNSRVNPRILHVWLKLAYHGGLTS